MRLYERLGDTGYHTAIISTFGLDFAAFETIALSRLRAAGCRNVILVADSAMVGLALDGGAPLPQVAGTQYLLAKASANGGVFHPKIVLQLGRKGGRMIVASANATVAGLAGNLELASIVECGVDDSGEQRIVAAGWQFLGRFLDGRQQAVADKLDWARARTQWLGHAQPVEGLQKLADGTEAAFLASGAAEGIGAQFLRMVGGAVADRLVVVSPYWDEGLVALRRLQEDLDVADTAVLIDTAQGLFPVAAVGGGRAVRIVELAGFDEKRFSKTNRRFVHAKLILAATGATDHVLVGSANCTLAALGHGSGPGINEEACLYRRLPAGRVLVGLGLDSIANGDAAVDPAELPPFDIGEALPLSEARTRDPGIFEAVFDRLHWWPASPALATEIVDGSVAVEVIGDGDATTIALAPDVAHASGKLPLRFMLPGKLGRPRLARIRYLNGHFSGFAIVACVSHLRSETREPMSSRAEKASQALEDANEEGLWLLEILDDLEAGDSASVPNPLPASVLPSSRKEKEAAPQNFQTLDYTAFLAGRRRRVDPNEAERNSLAGSTSSLVRGFLNRLAGISPIETEKTDSANDDEQILRALDTGDEVADGASAIEGGMEPGDPAVHRPPAAHAALRRLADARAFSDAVSTYRARITAAASISPKEVLRLRALVTAIAIAGFCDATEKPTAVQVLPTVAGGGIETWPRLMGRALETIFGARESAIQKLRIDPAHDRWPSDILEAWATCIWASEAALDAARAIPALSNLVPILTALAGRVALLTAVTAEERSSSEFLAVHQAMARRFQDRLGLNEHSKPAPNSTGRRSGNLTRVPGEKKKPSISKAVNLVG